MNRFDAFSKPRSAAVWIALILTVLPACNPQQPLANVLQGISLAPGQTPALDIPLQFILNGIGNCAAVRVDWGDGNDTVHTVFPTIDFSGSDANAVASRTLTHTFTGWGGGKTVTVDGTMENGFVNCFGRVNFHFEMPPVNRNLGWAQPAPSATPGGCQSFTPALPAMIPRMLVDIDITMVAGQRGIDFGCFAGGCVYDADGRPGSVADSRFPFPGLREYSVVYRIGTQVVQGGTDTQFTTTASGPLEFCLNDGDQDLSNNKGGFNVTIRVDQLGP